MKTIHTTAVTRRTVLIGEILPGATIGQRMRTKLRVAAQVERTKRAREAGADLSAEVLQKPSCTVILVRGPVPAIRQTLRVPGRFNPFIPAPRHA